MPVSCLVGGPQGASENTGAGTGLSCPSAPAITPSHITGTVEECLWPSVGSWEPAPAGQEPGPGDLRVLAHLGFQVSDFSSGKPGSPAWQPCCPRPPSVSARDQPPEPQLAGEVEALSWTRPSPHPVPGREAGGKGQGARAHPTAQQVSAGQTHWAAEEREVNQGGWRSTVITPHEAAQLGGPGRRGSEPP